MFKKTKSKVLVDYASEEDDMSWHYHHSYKDKDMGEEEEEEAGTATSKEAKVKKIMSKKERREKKMFSSKDDEHLLLSGGVKLADRKGPQKKAKEGEKEKKDKPDKGYCFWDSITMTMRQISPAKKLEKMEGWEPPQLGNLTETVNEEPPVENSQKGELAVSLPNSSIPVDLPSWGGRGFEEDSSRYANLTDSNESAAAVRWTSRAKVKLAGISRISRGIVSESSWGGFK
uniref:Chromosome 8 open reading frame 42 n=2 Tax=Nothobranchius korthausae TaxID=1143690 RepID=A0A1A8F5S4_9TELE